MEHNPAFTRRPFQFPYHAGFATRGLTTSLLYHGGLNATLPGWIAPEITENVKTCVPSISGYEA
jgi:hypothetical protein